VICGLIYGAPQRQDFGNSLIFESGSQWSQPLYTCASALKATIKMISLSYNGTDISLENLAVTDIQDKVYPEGRAPPFWGVENTSFFGYEEHSISLIWGLVSGKYANHENVSTVRQNSLYLPGYYEDAILNTIGLDFTAGDKAFFKCLGSCLRTDWRCTWPCRFSRLYRDN
jgi:hypothetical protein